MKIRISQSELRRPLDYLGPVATEGEFPYIVLDAEGENVVAAASNAHVSLRFNLTCSVSEPGRLAISAATLRDYVANLAAGEVTIESTDEGGAKVVGAGGSTAVLTGVSLDTLPEFPAVTYGGIVLPAIDLIRGAELVPFAAAREESALSGVRLAITGERLVLAAADGRRAARASFPLEGAVAGGQDVIIPPRALALIGKIFEPEGAVSAGFDGTSRARIGFRKKGREMVVRLIDGIYPNIDAVIPTSGPTAVTVDRQALLQVVGRVSVVAARENRAIEIRIGREQLALGSAQSPFGEAHDTLPVQAFRGTEMTLQVNGELLARMIQSVPGDRVVLEFTTVATPILIRPTPEGIPGGWSLDYLLMPVRPRA